MGKPWRKLRQSLYNATPWQAVAPGPRLRVVNTMASKAYQKVKATNALPSPSSVALEIMRLASNDRATLRDVATVVETDPDLASRLLKYVNSPLVGVSRHIASVQQAVALLGLEVVKGFALGASLISRGRKVACARFDYEAFRSESVARAVIVRHFSLRLNDYPADAAFTCGLLCQTGRLAFATAFPEAYAHALSLAAADDPRQLIETEREAFDFDHNDLAAAMMADWHLPAIFRDAVRYQDSPDEHNLDLTSDLGQLAQLLNLAGVLSLVLTRSRIHRETMTTVVDRADRLDVTRDALANIFDSISEEWCAHGAIFDVGTRKVPPFVELYGGASNCL